MKKSSKNTKKIKEDKKVEIDYHCSRCGRLMGGYSCHSCGNVRSPEEEK